MKSPINIKIFNNLKKSNLISFSKMKEMKFKKKKNRRPLAHNYKEIS